MSALLFFPVIGIQMYKTSKVLILLVALSLSLSACTEKKSAGVVEPKIGVKVNGQPISVAELDNRSGRVDDQNKHDVSEAKMKHAVDMELIRQAAVQSKLDADEDVRAKIAISTRTILAMAYMEKQLDAVGNPTEVEITDYYNNNPARFGERKQYEINEFSIQPPAAKVGEIQAQLAKVKKDQEFDQWLTGNNIPHSSSPVTVTADRLPDDVLQKLKDVPVGGHVVLGGNEQMNVLFVLSEHNQPVALAAAKPMIASRLMEKRRSETIDNMVKQLRDKAKVEYVPPYSASGLKTSDSGE